MSAFGIGGFAAGLSSGLKDARGLMLDREEVKKLKSERAARERKDERRERALELQGELDKWRAPGIGKNTALEVAGNAPAETVAPTSAIPTEAQPRVAPTPAEPVQRSQDEIRRELDRLRSQASMDGDTAAAAEFVRLGQMKALATVGRALDPSSGLTPQHQADLINRGASWITGSGYNGVYVDKAGNLAHADLGPIDSPEKVLGVKAYIAALADPNKANDIATELRDKWEVQANARKQMDVLERRMNVEEGTLELRWDELQQKADQFNIKLAYDMTMFVSELQQKQGLIDAQIAGMEFENEEAKAKAKYYMSEAALNDAERVAMGLKPLWDDYGDAYKQSEALNNMLDKETEDSLLGEGSTYFTAENAQAKGFESPEDFRVAFQAIADDVIWGGGDGMTAPKARQITAEIFNYAQGDGTIDDVDYTWSGDDEASGDKFIKTSGGVHRVNDRVYGLVKESVVRRTKAAEAADLAQKQAAYDADVQEKRTDGAWTGGSGAAARDRGISNPYGIPIKQIWSGIYEAGRHTPFLKSLYDKPAPTTKLPALNWNR